MIKSMAGELEGLNCNFQNPVLSPEKKIQIFILKRSNGFIGIYVGEFAQENLVCNFEHSMKASYLFDRITSEISNLHQYPVEIIFTEEEEKFVSGLPSLQEYLISNKK